MTDADRRALIHLTRHTRKVGRHQTLVEEGGSCPRIHIILNGWACRSKLLAEGQRLITDLILPGDACHPYTGLLDTADHSLSMLTEGTVADVEPAEMAHLLAEQPGAARALQWSSLQVDSILRQALMNNSHRLADARIAHLICELQARLRVVGRTNDNQFEWPITQEELGAVVAISNVHANRSLQELRAKHLISLSKRTMIVLDLTRLTAYCDFKPNYLHFSDSTGADRSERRSHW